MIPTIQQITIGQLPGFLQSEQYKQMDFLPIGYIRAISHINNPRANTNDIALFLAYHNNIFIGYLGAMPDNIYLNGKEQKIYFLSCMFVPKEYRRHKIAHYLMVAATNTLDENILITNFIPSAKAVYDTTGKYTPLVVYNGIRAYLRFDFGTIIPRHHRKWKKLGGILKATDAFLNIFNELRLKTYPAKIAKNLDFLPVTQLTNAEKVIIDKLQYGNLFRRSIKEFNWIIQNPWVIETPIRPYESGKYFFSDYKNQFKQLNYLVRKDGRTVGFFMATITNNELKTPYLLIPGDLISDVKNFIIKLMLKNKVKTFVCHHKALCAAISEKNPFFHIRASERGFLTTKKLKPSIPEQAWLNDGDGDGVFT